MWDVALPLFLIMQPWLHYMGKAFHVLPERMQHLNLKHEALWAILHTRSNFITRRVAQISVGGPPMKCKSLSFSARKRSMMDACQARDESRAELLSWKCQNTSISYAACVKEPIQNSFLLILRRQLSTGLSKSLHESSVHVIVGLTTMFSTHGMIKFFVWDNTPQLFSARG